MINTIILNSLDKPDDYIVGYAGLNGIIKDSAFPYGIVIGKRLDDKIIDSISIGPTLEYFNYYKSINNQLSEIIHQIGNKIMENGYACEIVEPSNDDSGSENKEYELTLRTSVSHKMIGTRAGLGWIGKTDLFISNKFGPRLRLVSLLTDYPLEISDSPINKSRCGICSECVINCPANAATGALWDIYTDRDVFFDAHKCRTKCRELSKSRLNLNSSTCGICISVCPVGKLKQKTEE